MIAKMVILTSMTVFSSTISAQKSLTNMVDDDPTGQVVKNTHLHLERRSISQIGEVCRCPKLTVLYLYENKLEQIQNLDFCPNLVHLYLQSNRLRRIENLHHLTHLRKLFLSNNRICILEGLEHNHQLEELHIDHQTLEEGEIFCISPSSMASLSHTLTFLDIGGNGLTSISDLRNLTRLTCLHAAKNQLSAIESILPVLQAFTQLNQLDFTDNPVVKTFHYREMITMAITKLEELDGKKISDISRRFLLRMKESRSRNNTSFSLNTDDITSSTDTPSQTDNFPSKNLRRHRKMPLQVSRSQEASSKCVLPALITTPPLR